MIKALDLWKIERCGYYLYIGQTIRVGEDLWNSEIYVSSRKFVQCFEVRKFGENGTRRGTVLFLSIIVS